MTTFAHDTVVPYKTSAGSKTVQVAEMFDDIAPRYDFLNHFLSAGIDKIWRKKAIDFLKDTEPKFILDVATGTGDMALLLNKTLRPARVTGIDISEGMLKIGREKIKREGVSQTVELQQDNSESLHFEDNSFDATTVAFGVRNFQNLKGGLSEIRRVLKPGAKVVVLEFSRPRGRLIGLFYRFYMKQIAARIGRAVSKNTCAYEYLDESINKFPEGKNFLSVLEACGFKNSFQKKLTFGICSIYCATK